MVGLSTTGPTIYFQLVVVKTYKVGLLVNLNLTSPKSYYYEMKLVLVVCVIIFITGCASTPQEEVEQLDVTHPNYSTIECREARSIALQYDPKIAERMGAGFLLGLLGPVGIGLAVATDVAQNQKGEAVINELKLQCEGEPRESSQGDKDSLTVRLNILKDLLTKELITQEEYDQLRARALAEF